MEWASEESKTACGGRSRKFTLLTVMNYRRVWNEHQMGGLTLVCIRIYNFTWQEGLGIIALKDIQGMVSHYRRTCLSPDCLTAALVYTSTSNLTECTNFTSPPPHVEDGTLLWKQVYRCSVNRLDPFSSPRVLPPWITSAPGGFLMITGVAPLNPVSNLCPLITVNPVSAIPPPLSHPSDSKACAGVAALGMIFRLR